MMKRREIDLLTTVHLVQKAPFLQPTGGREGALHESDPRGSKYEEPFPLSMNP